MSNINLVIEERASKADCEKHARAALSRSPRHGAEIIGNFSLPKFGENFDLENGITNTELKLAFNKVISQVKTVFSK